MNDVVIIDAGIPGPIGLSAYQVSVKNGFVGTEAQWLASLSAVGYEHQQPNASDTWTMNHNLDRRVSVDLFSAGGAKIVGSVTNINTNQSIASFDTPIAGYAIII